MSRSDCPVCWGEAGCPCCEGTGEELPLVIREADPELVALLEEEEEIERQTRK